MQSNCRGKIHTSRLSWLRRVFTSHTLNIWLKSKKQEQKNELKRTQNTMSLWSQLCIRVSVSSRFPISIHKTSPFFNAFWTFDRVQALERSFVRCVSLHTTFIQWAVCSRRRIRVSIVMTLNSIQYLSRFHQINTLIASLSDFIREIFCVSRYNQIIRIVNSSLVAVYRSVYIKCEMFARLDYVIKSVLIWKKVYFQWSDCFKRLFIIYFIAQHTAVHWNDRWRPGPMNLNRKKLSWNKWVSLNWRDVVASNSSPNLNFNPSKKWSRFTCSCSYSQTPTIICISIDLRRSFQWISCFPLKRTEIEANILVI